MNVFHEEIIHLPDFQFVSLCRDNFGLNKGVYNEIDSWFFENGFKNIADRRKEILLFLNSKTDYIIDGKLKFGPNKLNEHLAEHINAQSAINNVVCN
jgi:hypothetical protein